MQAIKGFGACSLCSQIDFDDAFHANAAIRLHGQRVVCTLSHRDLQQASCQLCHFFSHVSPVEGRYRELRAFDIGQNLSIEVSDDKTRSEVALAIASRTDAEASTYPSSNIIIKSHREEQLLRNDVDWEVLRDWLGFCSSNHPLCSHPKSNMARMGTLRVIDCDTLEVVEIGSPHQQYATLSYVWGISQGRVGGDILYIQPDNTPPLIMDAINTTNLLGIRYLWIDRYCIRDDDQQEKHALIRNMGYIYANSCLTIITSCSDDPSHGITGIGHNLRQQPSRPELHFGEHHLVSPLISVKQEVEGSLWNSRGWTYQEALLAPRRLVFTQSQVYFQCYEMHCFESLGNIGVHQPAILPSLVAVFPEQGVGSSLDDIRSRILEYSKRSLTFETDTFRAIFGVLQLFVDKFGFRHLCGLPVCPIVSRLPASLRKHSSRGCRWMQSDLNNLVISLTWAFEYQSEVDPPQPIRRRSFPSWSWVGWQFSNIATRFSLPGLPNQYVGGRSLIPKSSVLPRPLHAEAQRRYCNSYCLEPCAQLEVEFDDGVRIPWAGQENEILSHGDSENIPRLLHIQTWVAKVVARFVPALGRNVYPTWMFKLAPGGTTFCPFANQGLDVDMELNMDSESDSTTTNVIYCPPARQEQIVNLDIKDGLAGILEFAWAINDIPSNEAGPVVPELVAVVMSACETGLVALLVTPVVGTDHYEFCGVRRFRFYPAHDLEEIDVWPGEEDTPLKSPFPSVDIDALHDDDEFETFTHHRIEFEWREIVLG